MKASPSRISTFLLMFLVFAHLGAVPSQGQCGSAGDFDRSSLSWRRLVFEGKQAMGKARTQVQLEALRAEDAATALIDSPHGEVEIPGNADVLLISTEIEAKFLFERKKWKGWVWFLPDDGTALQRIRHKPGKGASDKRLRYGPDGVYRRRAEPKNKREAELGADNWTKVWNAFYGYGKSRTDCGRISDPLVLFYVVSTVGMSEGYEFEVCVFNKKELYRVVLQSAGTERLEVDYTEKRGQSKNRVKRRLDALKIRLRPRLKDPSLKEPEAFEFMGLTGDLQILLDPQTGIPVGVRGELPVAGKTDFKLSEVNLTADTGKQARRLTENLAGRLPRH